jgi:ferric-dicitrate binding protein FerR (iron transport regulator)
MNQEIIEKYIAGEANPVEKETVFEWAKADENNMKELLALRKLYDISIWRQAPSGRTARINRSVIYKIASIAAMFIVLCGSVYTLYNRKTTTPDEAMQTIRVPAGQRAELVLTDGTSVWLNAGSTFSFPAHFSKNKREVVLDGEAYFSVEKDAKKPFIVKTLSHEVKVLGTEFNVLAYNKSSLFEVSLLKGSVEVYAASQILKLEPQTRVYQVNNELIKGEIDNLDYLLWKDGLICFDDEPVEQMISKLELYFDTKIVVEKGSFMKKKYTGKFRTKDGIEHILKVFQLKDRFTYEKDDEKNRIIIK